MHGVLKKYNVEMIGAFNADTIDKAEKIVRASTRQ
jgi:carbamoylphosphate synthase large subunit